MKQLLLAFLLAAGAARAEDVEVTAGAVTGLSCAIKAQKTGDLRILGSCPPAESKDLAVFDVAEKRIYKVAGKKVARYQLESAYGGGSIDFSGKSVKTDPKTQVTTVDVAEFSINKKPKPGASKACL